MEIVCLALGFYGVLLFGRVILSWFPIEPRTPLARAYSVLFDITEPLLGPVRRALPPMRLGATALDLSPIVVIFGLQLVRGVLC